MFQGLIEKIKFIKKFGRNPSAEQFIQEWSRTPEKYFFGYHDKKLKWSTFYSSDFFSEHPMSHGLSFFPDIRCQYKACEYSLLIGNIERISMHSGGIVCIKHFALDPALTKRKIGGVFFNAILTFFKDKNAVVLEFHEDHSSKIEHYRRFFEKIGIEEVKSGVWRLELYNNEEVPEHVLDFHELLKQEHQ
jgi:hypothetical protein